MDEVLKAVPVVIASMIKFIGGPLVGFASHVHFISTVLATVIGMMAMVVVFTFFGEWLKVHVISRFRKKKSKLFTPSRRKYAGLWKKYGLAGIAFLTPLFLTPIGGTLIAVSSGSPKEKIIFYMFVSAAAWSMIFTGIIYFFGKEFLPEFAD
jgi:membrane protein DedA with SNARE-associated domain